MQFDDRGDAWIEMMDGSPFFPLDPRPEDIHIVDITHGLSNLCRFNGHVINFYSVAQHSVHVAEFVEKQLRKGHYYSSLPSRVVLAALLHDASEAYLVDVPRPVKRQMLDYVRAEKYLEAVIRDRFDLTEDCTELIKLGDDVMLATEKRDLKPNGKRDWRLSKEPIPTPYRVVPWTPEEARARFMWKFEQLTK